MALECLGCPREDRQTSTQLSAYRKPCLGAIRVRKCTVTPAWPEPPRVPITKLSARSAKRTGPLMTPVMARGCGIVQCRNERCLLTG